MIGTDLIFKDQCINSLLTYYETTLAKGGLDAESETILKKKIITAKELLKDQEEDNKN